MNKKVSVALGFAVSAALVFWAFWGIDYRQLWSALRDANYFWLAPYILLILFNMYQRAWRWQSMAKPIKRVSFDTMLSATAIGFMANNVLPLRLGEFVRAYALSRQEKGISKSASLAMIFTERIIFDLAALIGLFGLVIWVTQVDVPANIKQGSEIILVVAISGFVFALVVAKWSASIRWFLEERLGALPLKLRRFLGEMLEKFALGLQFMRDPVAGLWVLAQTIGLWVVMGISNYFCFLAMGLDLPIEASFAVLTVVAIAITVPSSPGFVGVYHLAVWKVLERYGIAQADAVACAVIMHAAQYITVTLYGLYYLKKARLSLRDMEREVTAGSTEPQSSAPQPS